LEDEGELLMGKNVTPLECKTTGEEIYRFAERLFPICRSITGDGVRETLKIIHEVIPSLRVVETPSGEEVFDWNVPLEWNIQDAYLVDPNGRRFAEFNKSNLHVVGYSIPVDLEIDLCDLENHLHSLPDKPDVIPYVTSYYERRWGFCLSHNDRVRLIPGKYRAVINSSLKEGSLTYGEILIPGKEKNKEIFLSSYICHPSMANNEVSGPAVLVALGAWLASKKDELNYSYRLALVPETIGSLVYIRNNRESLTQNVVCGFNVTCVGDNRAYSFLPSRYGTTLADRVAKHVLKHIDPAFRRYSFLDRGSDERQYCAPGVDLPLCSIMRSKYQEYPEYHTSADNLDLISPSGLKGSLDVLVKCVEVLENNVVPESLVVGEPQLSKRGLYSTLGAQGENSQGRLVTDILAYADGSNSLLDIAEIIGCPFNKLLEALGHIEKHKLMKNLGQEV
jgi:aminopeptidase-like protein